MEFLQTAHIWGGLAYLHVRQVQKNYRSATTEQLNITKYDFFRKKMRFRLDFLHLTVYYTQIRSPM